MNSNGCPIGVCDFVKAQPKPMPSDGPSSSAWSLKANISFGDIAELATIAPDGSSIDLLDELAARTLDNFSCSVVGKIFGRRLPA